MYNSNISNKNLNTGVITCIQDYCCYNYDIKKASWNNGINRYNIEK